MYALAKSSKSAEVLSVVADTNVYISALEFGGNPERLLRLAEAGAFRPLISDSIVSEISKVLRGDKFRWPVEDTSKALRLIARLTEHVQPHETLHVITADPSDDRILECAVTGGADYIVSGDNHLLKFGQFQGIKIVTPAAFVNLQAAQAGER